MLKLVRSFFALLAGAVLSCGNPPSASAANRWHVQGTPAVFSQPVTFEHADAMLRGTLYRPQLPGRVPAVVVLHGAEIGNADAALYRHLREGLPAIGIAVFIFDRRGTSPSTGSLKNVSYEMLADDGIAAARTIAKLPAIDSSHIGYWGLSQGGWLAVLAAKRDSKSAFAVSVSAPLVTPESQMEFAMANRLQINGYPAADVNDMLVARKAWTGYLRGSVPRATALQALSQIDRKPWFDLVYMPSASELTTDPSTSSWRKEMDDDPVAAVQGTKVPTLFIYGGADPWIPVDATIKRVATLAKTRPNVEYAVISGASHDMMFRARETMDTSQASLQTEAPEAPAYFMLLASWLTEHAR